MQYQNGFSFIGILIAITIIALLAGSGLVYFTQSIEQAGVLSEPGVNPIERAEEVKNLIETRDQQILEDLGL